MLSFEQCIIIAFVAFTYDYLLTFEDEVALVWKSGNKKSLVYISYLLARYIPLPTFIMSICSVNEQLLPIQFGDSYYIMLVAMASLGVYASQAIIFARTYAIWPGELDEKRPVLVFLSFLFVVSPKVFRQLSVSFITMLVIGLVFESCLLGYGLIIANESTILCMTLIGHYRLLSYFRRNQGLQAEKELAVLVFWDCIVYFACILGTSIINLILTFVIGSPDITIDTPDVSGAFCAFTGLPQIQLSLHGILSTRVVLNLRGRRLESEK